MLLSVLTGICLVAAVAAIAALIKAGALSKQLDEFRKAIRIRQPCFRPSEN